MALVNQFGVEARKVLMQKSTVWRETFFEVIVLWGRSIIDVLFSSI